MAGTVDAVVTFDNLGAALEISRGERSLPDPDHPSLRVGLPRIERLLADVGYHTTFFIEGWNLLHHAGAVEKLAAAGHQIGLHGWLHERWAKVTRTERQRCLADALAVASLRSIPVDSFRAPGGYLTEDSPSDLADAGITKDSSLLPVEDQAGWDGSDDEEPTFPQPRRLAPRLMSLPFRWRHVDQWHFKFRMPPILDAGRVIDAWVDEIEGAPEGQTFMFVAHPFAIAVDDTRFAHLSRFITWLASSPRVRLLSFAERIEEAERAVA